MTDDGDDALPERIARALAACAPPGWRLAKASTEIDSPTMSTSEYDYVDADGTEHWLDPDTATTITVGSGLRAIRAQAIEAGQPAWSRCTFTVTRDGAFRLDIVHDDRDE